MSRRGRRRVARKVPTRHLASTKPTFDPDATPIYTELVAKHGDPTIPLESATAPHFAEFRALLTPSAEEAA